MTSPRAWELGALALALAVWSFVGWDTALWDGRLQLVLHLAAAAALGGVALVAVRGGALPRTRVDLPIIVLLLAFGVAALFAWNPGLSARALAAIVATAAMLPVALVALRHRPGWTALVVTVPIIALAAGALAVLAWRRLEWIMADAPGLPPVRLAHEGTPFGSVAVPPFVILAALPLALVIPWRRARLAVVGLLVGLGVPLTVISGSRSAWIAIAVAALVLGVPVAIRWLRGVDGRRGLTARAAVGALVVVGAGAAVAAYLAPRVGEVSSLVYRENLWRDTLAAWRSDPLIGIGPGAMPFARQAAAADFSFPVNQPHSHNVLLGILGDAGLVGLGAALALVVTFAWAAAPWRQRSLPGRAAVAVLAGLAAGMQFEDLTFLPNFNLEVVLLAALALEGAAAVRWQPSSLPHSVLGARVPAVVAGSALALLMLLGDASRIAYDAGIDAAERDEWQLATTWLERSVALDPWQPSGARSLAVAADYAGEPDLALSAARNAVELNPGDSLSWTNVAVLCRGRDDRDCAQRAANRAVETARFAGPELANAARVFAWLGDEPAADAAYARSLATNWWTAITVPWPRTLPPDRAAAAELDPVVAELNAVIARGWQGLAIDPGDYATREARMLAEAVTGHRQAALALADRLEDARPASAATWQLIALVRGADGQNIDHELAVARVASGRPLPEGPARMPRSISDIASFRAYPVDGLVSEATRLLPDEAWPWVLEPLLAPISRPAAGGG